MNQDFWNDFHLFSLSRSKGIQFAAVRRTNAMKYFLEAPEKIQSYEIAMCILQLLHDYMTWTCVYDNKYITQNYIDLIIQREDQYRKSLEDLL